MLTLYQGQLISATNACSRQEINTASSKISLNVVIQMIMTPYAQWAHAYKGTAVPSIQLL